jgi:hypothetical protein
MLSLTNKANDGNAVLRGSLVSKGRMDSIQKCV